MCMWTSCFHWPAQKVHGIFLHSFVFWQPLLTPKQRIPGAAGPGCYSEEGEKLKSLLSVELCLQKTEGRLLTFPLLQLHAVSIQLFIHTFQGSEGLVEWQETWGETGMSSAHNRPFKWTEQLLWVKEFSSVVKTTMWVRNHWTLLTIHLFTVTGDVIDGGQLKQHPAAQPDTADGQYPHSNAHQPSTQLIRAGYSESLAGRHW